MVPVRATVTVGGLSCSTPYVVSFNVNRARGSISTFSATLKVRYGQVSNAVGGDVKISAGTAGSERLIYTGICRSSNITPCRDDPSYVMLTISGEDILSELKGKKITRRCKSSKTTWIAITGVVRKGLKDSKLAYQKGSENFRMESPVTNEQDPVVRSVTTATVVGDKDVSETPSRATDKGIILEVVAVEPDGGAGI